MSNFKIDPFFPDKNLNPQGWVTDFITSRMDKVGKQRSDLANLIYDETLTDETKKSFSVNDDLANKIAVARKKSPKDKSFYLNPLYYDAVERNSSISAKTVENEKTLRDYYSYMINAGPNEISSFVPSVRLKFGYKKSIKDKTFTEAEVPFKQNLQTEISSMLADKFSRGQGAGIKSVTAEKSFPGLGLTLNVSVNITYFFSSMTLLGKKITNSTIPDEFNFTYSKLITFLPLTQRLFLEYGNRANSYDETLTPALKKRGLSVEEVVKAETKRIALSYKGHKIDIQEDGTLIITANYMALSEAQFFQKNDVTAPSLDYANKITDPALKSVFSNYIELSTRNYKLQNELRDFTEQEVELQSIGNSKKKLDDIKKQKQIKTKQLEYITKQLSIVKQSISPYIFTLLTNSIIDRYQMFSIAFSTERKENIFNIAYYLNLISKDDKGKQVFIPLSEQDKGITVSKDLDSFRNFDTSVLFSTEAGTTKENIFEQILVNLFDGVKRQSGEGSKKFGYITFFPLKALIAILYELLPNEGDLSLHYKIPYLCLGNVVSRSFNREYTINIGDVLIELETFRMWLHRNFIQKNRTEYSFSSFVIDLMEELVPDALYRKNTGFYRQNALGTIRHLSYFTNTSPTDPILQKIYKEPVDFSELKKIFVPEQTKDAKPMIYFTQMLSPLNDYTSPYFKKYIAKAGSKSVFNAAADSQFGIPHASIGASKGLIKKINFNSIEQPFLATSLIMQSMVDGSTTLPRYAYHVTVEMMGNNLFNQAGFLAVPPFGVETSQDLNLGLTGYYVVTKINDTISPEGGYFTTVTGIWHDNPLLRKEFKATIKGSKYLSHPSKDLEKKQQDLKENIGDFVVEDYIKDLLSLDVATLKALGIVSVPTTEQQKATEQEKNTKKKKPKPRDRNETGG